MRNSNTSHNRRTAYGQSYRWIWAGLVVVCLAGTAQALDPNRVMSEYRRDHWDTRQGFPGGPVYAIAQTPDGYLWLGTEKGLVRFDGLNFRLFNHTNTASFPVGPVLDLMTDSEGNLWIRPQSRNMLLYRDGTFYDVLHDLDGERSGVTAMCLGVKGEALFEVLAGGIFVYSGGKFSRLAPAAALPNLLIISMAQTGDGKIWLGTRDAGLFYVTEGQMFAVTQELPDKKINCLLAVDERQLWIGTDNGIVRWDGDRPEANALGRIQALAITRDHQSNIWISTGNRLLRLTAGGVSSLEEGYAGAVNAIFEDREGNLWIGSTQGIERLRDTAVMMYTVLKDRPSSGNGAIYIDAEGRIWFAPSDGGLYWQKDGQTGSLKNDGLDRDVVYSMTGSKGELWIGRRYGGLTRLRYEGNSFAAQTYTQAQGLAQNSNYAVHQSRDGTVWAGSISGGLTRFKDGKFTRYTTVNGLASNTVTAILESSGGTMWFGTANGLCSLSQDNWTIYGGLDGLPPGSVNCLLEDSGGAIWIGTDKGIAVLRSGQIRIPQQAPESLHEPIRGVVEDREQRLWISTSNHMLWVERDRLLGGLLDETDVREFGLADGLSNAEGVKRHRPVIIDTLGRIWFSTYRGLSVVDPAKVAGKPVPAIAHIEVMTADGSAVDTQGRIKIPGARQRITFSYAGLSLSVPERVRFRYKLDGFDQDFSEPVAAREAVYTNLGPGSYRFRVRASNSDGFWNGVEASIQFEIEPVFWQTWWFRISCVMAIGVAALIFYRLRLRRLTTELNMRFEERLAERTRIAQDLHDTLLQGFLSASMQLDVAADYISEDSSAKPLVGRVLELMRQVIDEGRNALKGLRSPNSNPQDLAESFSRIQEELAFKEQVEYQVIVEGISRPLRPVTRDEIYRIGREALVNAFRHSKANHIEVVLKYGARQLRIIVRDNGCGIDSQVLRSGREGHWGLSGMRERAEEIGARLKVWSGAGLGTEVELFIPGDIAFEPPSSERRRGMLTRLYTRKTRTKPLQIKKQGK